MKSNFYRIFIDESCHLENDHFPIMGIGYVKVNEADYKKIKADIKKTKLEFKTPTELKWTKVSLSRLPFYKALIDYFFSHDICFRSILVKYKDKLDHDQFNQGEHDNFYYKMIYYLLRPNNGSEQQYRVFLDIKDTWGRSKLRKIKEVFQAFHQGQSPFVQFQHIRSHESEFIQLVDLFLGAITFKARNEHLKSNANPAKLELIRYLEEASGYTLDEGTVPWENKFNIFDHQPRKRR
ncbi:DUF3800 domain-containing protein [candidate division KSB1 bacterium]|nr:DUF3800 domain-containing protein [candidate division KSB1 bacterium]